VYLTNREQQLLHSHSGQKKTAIRQSGFGTAVNLS
jgi:hypothetical protein